MPDDTNLTQQTALLQKILIELKQGSGGSRSGGGGSATEASRATAGRTTALADVSAQVIEDQEQKLEDLNIQLKRTNTLYSNLSEGITKKYTAAIEEATIKQEENRLGILQDIKALNEKEAELRKSIASQEAEHEALTEGDPLRQNLINRINEEKAALAGASTEVDKLKNKERDLNKELGITERRLKGEQGLANHISELGKKMTGSALKTGGFGDSMNQLGKQFRTVKGGGGSAFKALASGATDFAKSLPLKFFDAIVSGTMDLAKAQDKAISAFRRATGAGKEYNLAITRLERSTRFGGVTAAEAGKAYETLFTSFSQFTQLSETEQATVSETTALLNELGVSGQTTAKIFDQMSRSLGMSVESSNDVMLRLAGTAKSVGVSMSKMASDFQGAFSELSKYGDGAIDVFEGLAKQAKATGMEVGKLMSLAKQFDTFDGAAKSVGRLNAILGGPYLNSIDMLNASEAERIDLLKSSVDASGVQFDAMNRFEKQAMAAALGMSVEDASRIMKMSTAEMELQALQQEELAELAQNSQEIMDQLKNAFQSMLVDMRPLIENVIVPTVEFLGEIGRWFGTAESAMTRFMKVGLLAAGVAALIAAPFTGGASLGMWASVAAIGGGAGLIASTTFEGGGGGSAGGVDYERPEQTLATGGRVGTAAGLADMMMGRGGVVKHTPRKPDMMMARGGSQNQGGSFLDKLYASVGLNEKGPETAVLPYGTYVTNAGDTKQSIEMATAVVAELKGLREDLSTGGSQQVMLVMEDGQQFAASMVNASGMSPYG